MTKVHPMVDSGLYKNSRIYRVNVVHSRWVFSFTCGCAEAFAKGRSRKGGIYD